MSPEEKKLAFLDGLLNEIEKAHADTAERMVFNVSMEPKHLPAEAIRGLIGSIAKFCAMGIAMHSGFLEQAIGLDKVLLQMLDQMRKGATDEQLRQSPMYVATFALHGVLVASFSHCKKAHETLYKKGVTPE